MQKIPIRLCSWDKSNIERGYLPELYKTFMLQSFFRAFPIYAILSRKNGICMSGIIHENYSSSEELDDNKLKELLIQQYPDYKDVQFVYWNHRPMTHTKYVNIMKEAGFNVVEFMSLKEIQDYIGLDIQTELF